MNHLKLFKQASATAALSLVLGLSLSATPARCADATASSAAPGASVPAPPAADIAAQEHPVKAALHRLAARAHLSKDGFARAEGLFPSFCKDWQSKLQDRERNNIAHIDWQSRDGSAAGTYIGYGNIQSCTCKRTPKGIEIGKLTYQEFQYRLEGATLEEARHATPRPAAITNTTEIFRYDNKLGKWIY